MKKKARKSSAAEETLSGTCPHPKFICEVEDDFASVGTICHLGALYTQFPGSSQSVLVFTALDTFCVICKPIHLAFYPTSLSLYLLIHITYERYTALVP